MKKQFLLGLFLLASCSGQAKAPNLTEQPVDTGRYEADLEYCQSWAKPTKHEWAMRCAAQGDMVLLSSLIASFDADDPRDRDVERKSMPNNTQYRLNMCMAAKGYKVSMPDDHSKVVMQ